MLIPLEKSFKNCDITVYRFRVLPPLTEFYEFANKLLGRPYAYARYALDATRIFLFCFIVTGLLLSLFTWRVNIGMFITVGVLQALTIWFRKQDMQTDDCAEAAAKILDSLRLVPSLPKPRNEFPNCQENKMQMLCQYGLADKVGTWDSKTKKWENEF